MSLIRFNPFFGDEFLGDFFSEGLKTLALDVYEKDGKVVVEAPLAGINPKNVEVNIDNNILTIKGQEDQKSEVDEKNYFRKEVRHGSFYRNVRLPDVDESKAEAKFKDGILRIEVPKKEKEEKKILKIKVEEE